MNACFAVLVVAGVPPSTQFMVLRAPSAQQAVEAVAEALVKEGQAQATVVAAFSQEDLGQVLASMANAPA